MGNEKLISELSSYISEKGLKNKQVEIDIGLPKNSLSNFLALKKPLPDKWGEPILNYISQSNVVINTLGNLKDKVTTANLIPPKEMQKKILNAYDSWVQEIKNYCEKEGITPQDLILSHKERFKAVKSKKGTNTSKEGESPEYGRKIGNVGHSNWFNDYRKNKTGIK